MLFNPGITGSFDAGQILYGKTDHDSVPVLAMGAGVGTAGGAGTYGLFFRDAVPQLAVGPPSVPFTGANNAIGWFDKPGTSESFLIVTDYDGATTTMDVEVGVFNNSVPDANFPTGKHAWVGPCVAIPLSLRTSNISRVIVDSSGNVVVASGQLAAAAKLHVKGSGSSIALLQTSGGVSVLEVTSAGRADFNRAGGSCAIFTNSGSTGPQIFLKNTDATGYGGLEVTETTGATTKLALGFGNASYGDALRLGRSFIWTGAGVDFVITDSTVEFIVAKQASASLKLLGQCDDSKEGNVQTADATVTTLLSFTPTADRTVFVKLRVAGRRSDDAAGAGYEVTAAFRVTSGGAVTLIGAAGATFTAEDDATWNCTLDTDGTLIRARVTGVAATTIRWTGKMAWHYGPN